MDRIFSPIDIPETAHLKPLRLAVMASGNGSNFEAIAAAMVAGKINVEIAVLIHNKQEIYAIDRAAKYGIKTVYRSLKNYSSRQELDRAIVEVCQEENIDAIVMAGWMLIVTPVLIDAYRDRILNIHPSLLPSFPGIKAIDRALAASVKITGCSVHLVTEEVDSGPILMQAAVPILPTDTIDTLRDRIQACEHIIYPQAISIFQSRL
jgi:phosphoribosylglycinamide formyltransferase 1